ncbi:hypothetical protein HK102_012456 [Quaeritorhiza haematococci]|nr:hypothetical protein HK102_012456 [Quaeritorhiza haematococci]
MVIRDWRTMKVVAVLPDGRLDHICLGKHMIAYSESSKIKLRPIALSSLTDDSTSKRPIRGGTHAWALWSSSPTMMQGQQHETHQVQFESGMMDDAYKHDAIVGLHHHAETNTFISVSANGVIRHWDVYVSAAGETRTRTRWVVRDWPSLTTSCMTGDFIITAGGALDNQFISVWSISRTTNASGQRPLRKELTIPCSHPAVSSMSAYPIPEHHVWGIETLGARGNIVACNYGVYGQFLVFELIPASTTATSSSSSPQLLGFRLLHVIDEAQNALNSNSSDDEEDDGQAALFGLYSPKLCIHDRFLFVSSVRRSEVTVWDVVSGKQIYRLAESNGPEMGPWRQQQLVTSITDMSVTPDGTKLLVSAFGGMLYVWDVERGKVQTSYRDRVKSSRKAIRGFVGERMQKIISA